MPYAEQLLDPRWQRRKTEILERDKFTCQECIRTDLTLHVHHLDYLGFSIMAWEYPDDMLLTLCKPCHDKEKYRELLYPGLATALKFNGFLFEDLLCLTTMLHDKKFYRPLLKKLRKIQHG